jgi:hypothetical protein
MHSTYAPLWYGLAYGIISQSKIVTILSVLLSDHLHGLPAFQDDLRRDCGSEQ